MDNTRLSFIAESVDTDELARHLRALGITRTTRESADGHTEILFPMLVGKFEQRWLFRLTPKNRTITCSGGVTKTFYGHNAWVFSDNEWQQLQDIVSILWRQLSEVPGIGLNSVPADDLVDVLFAELTRHHDVSEAGSREDAMAKLHRLWEALYPKQYCSDRPTPDDPGTARIGKTKSHRLARAYLPSAKFGVPKAKPAHIAPALWGQLYKHCEPCVRVELIFDARTLRAAGLSKVSGWQDLNRVNSLIEERYRRFGLNVAYSDQPLSSSEFSPRAWKTAEAARHFFTGGQRGKMLPSGTGSESRFARYMADKGYNISVPFILHEALKHDLHHLMDPHSPAVLPPRLRASSRLFPQWWLGDDGG